jgi:hypothetical protein
MLRNGILAEHYNKDGLNCWGSEQEPPDDIEEIYYWIR